MIFNKIEEKFEKNNKKIMIEYGTKALNFDYYLKLKKQLLKELFNIGINKACCIALLISKNHINFILVAALQSINSIVLMLDSRMSNYELLNNLQTYKPDMLISDYECVPSREYLEKTHTIAQLIFDTKLYLFHRNYMSNWDNILKRDELKNSLVFFTSGSTRMPKAVFRTQKNVFEDAINNVKSFSITSADKVLCAVPFSHVYGFGSGSIPYLSEGATVKFINPASTFGILKKELLTNSYTVFVGLSIHYSMLVENFDTQLQLRFALVAGSALNPKLIELSHKKLGIYLNNMYGMTELGGITTLYHNICHENMYSAGQPLSNVSIKMGNIIQNEFNEKPLYEIYVKSKALSPGYYNHEDGSFCDTILTEGWFNTNDIGYIGKDKMLYVVCRNENMINCSGKKINPLEIEDVIIQYKDIKETAVIGRSDDIQGEIPIAYVVSENWVDKKAIIQFCYDKLPIYKVPRDIIQIEKIPRTSTGKLLRNNLENHHI